MAAQQAIDSVCEDDQLAGSERFRQSIKTYIQAIIGEDSASVVILEERTLSEEQFEEVVRLREKFEAKLRALIEIGQADGSIAPIDPKIDVFTALGPANWVTKWFRSDGEWSVDFVAEKIVNALSVGIAANPNCSRAG